MMKNIVKGVVRGYIRKSLLYRVKEFLGVLKSMGKLRKAFKHS